MWRFAKTGTTANRSIHRKSPKTMQAATQAADDNAVKWRELETIQTRSRDEAERTAEQRFAAFRAARR